MHAVISGQVVGNAAPVLEYVKAPLASGRDVGGVTPDHYNKTFHSQLQCPIAQAFYVLQIALGYHQDIIP